MRNFHRLLGLLTLAVFLITGAYMKFVAHPDRLAEGAHLMFVSRHIYILANALVQLSLAAYVVKVSSQAGQRAQWIASSLIAVSSVLLIAAFVLEPIAGRSRTLASSFGLYTLFAGTVLHFAIAMRRQSPP